MLRTAVGSSTGTLCTVSGGGRRRCCLSSTAWASSHKQHSSDLDGEFPQVAGGHLCAVCHTWLYIMCCGARWEVPKQLWPSQHDRCLAVELRVAVRSSSSVAAPYAWFAEWDGSTKWRHRA